MDTLREALLRAALPGPLSLDNAEEGHAALFPAVPAADFHAAIAAALAEGLIRDPVRLEEGALHCRWVLELTPSGRAAARRLTGD
jgi:hypothetical protein